MPLLRPHHRVREAFGAGKRPPARTGRPTGFSRPPRPAPRPPRRPCLITISRHRRRVRIPAVLQGLTFDPGGRDPAVMGPHGWAIGPSPMWWAGGPRLRGHLQLPFRGGTCWRSIRMNAPPGGCFSASPGSDSGVFHVQFLREASQFPAQGARREPLNGGDFLKSRQDQAPLPQVDMDLLSGK